MKDRSMEHKPSGGGITITAEQIAAAPTVVHDWLRSVVGQPPHADSFVLERAGVLSSEDGLAICSSLEIKVLLRRLADDYLACQVVFALGCELYDAVTGAHYDYVLHLNDFRDRTDVRDMFELDACFARINGVLREMRRDPRAVIQHCEGHLYRIHATTQQRIYRFWRHLVKQPPQHHLQRAAKAVA
jgi:hypothetical protein